MTSNSELKIAVDKLEGPEDWAKWKWHMKMIFRSYELESIVDGSKKCPEIAADVSTEDEKKRLSQWLKEDAKAASLIASSLDRNNSELVLTCEHAAEIWNKLSARFERSSTQRLNMLIESFFKVKKDEKEDISTHVAKLQKLFVDLNTELEQHNEAKLSERMLNGRILSTLGKEYDNFKDLWDTIPTNQQKLNLLIEKLCAIELRDSKNNDQATAFIGESKESNEKKHSFIRRGVDGAKSKYPCHICGKLGHWAAECRRKNGNGQRRNGNKRNDGKSNIGSNAFLTFMMNVTENMNRTADTWFCDSGASKHITPHKQYFETYEKFTVPEKVFVGKQNEFMYAYGFGAVKIKTFYERKWNDATLENVWYVPDASANLFSVKAVTEKGYEVTMDNVKLIIRSRISGKLAATGQLKNNLYVVNMKVIKQENAAIANLVSKTESLQIYHERLGHQNKRHTKNVLKRMGVNISEDPKGLCDGCALGKMHRLPFRSRQMQSSQVGELIHTDVNGPMRTTSLGGARYYVCFKDDYSKFRKLFFLKHKNEVVKVLEQFLNEAQTNEHVVKRIRSDGGGEFDNKEVAQLLAQRGIEQMITPPDTPQQNGSAERENRTVVEMARSMLSTSGLPKYLWAEACKTAEYILNRTGKSSEQNKFPYELWYNKEVNNIDHLKVFGTGCYVYVHKKFRAKFDAKSVFGNMIGYVNERDGYRVYIPSQKKVVCSHDVIFKQERTCKVNKTEENTTKMYIEERNNREEQENADEGEEHENENDEERNNREDQEDQENAEEGNNREEQEETEGGNNREERENDEERNNREDGEEESEETFIKRSCRKKKKPNWMNTSEFLMVSEEKHEYDDEPKTFQQAMESPNKKNWYAAMLEELESLKENETWTLVKRSEEVQVVKNKWVYKIKFSSDGSRRFKARLVAKGYSQQHGIDYDETFSPVARFDTIRILLAVAANNRMELAQFDVKTAFLYGFLDEEVYMEQPEGFTGNHPELVCRLNKSLYGLKQAPRCWNRRFINFMISIGFKISSADPCLFYKVIDKSRILYVALYVDDGLVVGSKQKDIDLFFEQLKQEFKITLGSLNNYLGMQINRNFDGSITLNQKKYIEKILKRFNMDQANEVGTPSVIGNVELSTSLREKVPYREAVGSLMYLMVATRPDIAFSVGKVARHIEKPNENDWNDVKRIFKYLKGTNDLCLKYHQTSNKQLAVYSDADYAGDTQSRKSTTGIVAMLAGGAVSWKSQLQQNITLSTMEAEIVAASEGAKEVMWLKKLWMELTGEEVKPTLFIDNASALKLAKNPEFHKKSKHVDIRHLYVREKFLNGDLELEQIGSKKQLGDLFTKPISLQRFIWLRSQIGVV